MQIALSKFLVYLLKKKKKKKHFSPLTLLLFNWVLQVSNLVNLVLSSNFVKNLENSIE